MVNRDGISLWKWDGAERIPTNGWPIVVEGVF